MPKAVSSNSIPVSKIQPVSLIDTLHELSHALQAYKAMLEHLIEKAARQADELRKHIRENRENPENTKELRNKFIAEQLQHGVSPEQISQALNLLLTAVNPIIESLSAGVDETKGTAS